MNQADKSNALATRVFALLQRKVSFELSKRLCLEDSTWQAEQSIGLASVIGREHYFERSQDFPIANRGDLVKSLRLMPSQSPISDTEYFFIERRSESSHRVTFYSFRNRDLLERRWLIPESLLIKLAMKKLQLSAIDVVRPDGKRLFALSDASGQYTSLSSDNTPTIEKYAAAQGVALGEVANDQAYSDLVFKCWFDALIGGYPGLFGQQKRRELPAAQALMVATGLLAGYLALSSGVISAQHWLAQSNLDGIKGETVSALALQREWRKQQGSYQALSGSISQVTDTSVVWEIIAAMMAKDHDLELSRIELNQGQYVIRGTATKASDILSEINEFPGTTAVAFTRPVRKERRGFDDFEIEFEMGGQG